MPRRRLNWIATTDEGTMHPDDKYGVHYEYIRNLKEKRKKLHVADDEYEKIKKFRESY